MNDFALTYKMSVVDSESARAFHFSHLRRQNKIIGYFIPKIFKVIVGDYKKFIKAIRENGITYAKAHLSVIVTPKSITPLLKELYLKCAYIESNFVLNYLRRGKKNIDNNIQIKRAGQPASFGLGFGDLAGVIDSYFKIRLLKDSAIPITETTKKQILRYLVSEIDNGKDYETAIADFSELAITGLMPKAMIRAKNIALTETTKAMSFGGLIGAYMSGIDCDKVWVTSDDERVRGFPNYPAKYPHVDLDLNASSIFGAFYNGEEIKFPGDPDASVENIAGCRCAMYFREKRKAVDQRRVKPRSLFNFLTDLAAGVITSLVIDEINAIDDEI